MPDMTNVADTYPPTPSQLEILQHALRDPSPELFVEQLRCDLVGPLDLDDLHAAWRDVTDRHSALRTFWLWEGHDQPVQGVRDTVELPWSTVDWRDRAGGDDIDDIAAADRAAGFDLSHPPAMRVTIVRIDDERVHLIWTFHRIMLDRRSTAAVLDEVLARLAPGTTPDDQATVRPFRDHIEWIAAQDAEAATAFWHSLLDGFEHPTRLAIDRGPSDQPIRLSRAHRSVDEATTSRLVAAAGASRVTVDTIVRSAWAMTLATYAGDDDIVFGVAMSGRPANVDGIERSVGMYVATLPMRVTIDPSEPTSQLWSRVQHEHLDITDFQYSPPADVRRRSDAGTEMPLFDTTVTFEDVPAIDAAPYPVRIERRTTVERTNQPLTITVGIDDRIEIVAQYDESRFNVDAVVRLLDGLVNVLDSSATEPDAAVRSHTVVSDDEQRRMLVDWNDSDGPIPDATVHQELDTIAAHRPDDPALLADDITITFGELRRRSERLAERLVAAGVSPGAAVGVAMPRSPDLVVALLATMRCGAAYVPLEPGTPRERLDVMIEEARVALALVSEDPDRELFATHGIPTITVDHSAPDSSEPVADGPGLPDIDPAATMFVIFTSGSTGRPKGVQGSHRAVLNRCHWQIAEYPFHDDEVACQKTTLNFVDHVAEIWTPLLAGRPIVIIPDDIVHDLDEFVTTLAEHRVRRLVLVPSVMQVLLDSVTGLADRLPLLELWTLSGERLTTALADRFRSAMPHATFLNVYGMSEAMADATWYDDRWSSSAETVPIGRPLRNQRVYLLDRWGRPVPVGIPGEINISGVGLSAGYWRHDELTAERFEPNPFGQGVHERRYNAGDYGRWTEDGMIEYLGRKDDQVKLRGIRVELGDVEAAVRRLDGVHEAVVVATTRDETRLTAFVVTDPGVDPVDLRRALRDRLPEYLVPARLRAIDAVPRLPSGKVDRRTLESVAADATTSATAAAAADQGDSIDDDLRSMVRVWQDLLDNPDIGPDDEFFDAGGHSMAAMRLMSRIQHDHDVNLPLATLFDASTPRSLVSVLSDSDALAGAATYEHLVPIDLGAIHSARTLFCVHGAGGNVLNFNDLATHLDGWAVVGIQARGVDGVADPHEAMHDICDAYLAELTAFHTDEPYFIAGFSSGGVIAYELGVRLTELGREVGGIVLLDTYHPAMQSRRRTAREHLSELIRSGPTYLRERYQIRRQRRLYSKAVDLVDDATSDGGPVPFELRDAHLVAYIDGIIATYVPPVYDGDVWLFTATDFILDPHVEGLARKLRGKLESSVTGRSSSDVDD